MRVRFIGSGEHDPHETVEVHGHTYEKGKWVDVSKLAGFEKSALNGNPTFEVQGGRLTSQELEKLHSQDGPARGEQGFEAGDEEAVTPHPLPPTLPGRLSSELPAGPVEEAAQEATGKPVSIPVQTTAPYSAKDPKSAPLSPAHAAPVVPEAPAKDTPKDHGKAKHTPSGAKRK